MIVARLLGSALIVLLFVGCAPDSPVSDGACSHCISYEAVQVLDFTEAPTLPSPEGHLFRKSDGRVAFVDRSVPYEILTFDEVGHFDMVVGTEGDGPGEFDRIYAVAFDSADTLWVASQRGRRLDLFGPDLNWVRTQSLPFSITTMLPLEEAMLISISEPGIGKIGTLGREGTFSELWSDSVAPGAGFNAGVSAITSDGTGRFWFAKPYTHEIWLGRTGGSLEPFIRNAPEWFGESYPPDVATAFPSLNTNGAVIVNLDLDLESGVLWVVTSIPSSEVTVEELRPLFDNAGSDREALLRALVDHQVEAYDLKTGERTASQRFDYLPVALFGGQYRVAAPERVEVVRPVLSRPSR